MGKCRYCGTNVDNDERFCSTKCKVEFEEKKREGKIQDEFEDYWLVRNWKIVLLFFIVVYVIDFFSGSKKSDNSVYERKDTTSTSYNTPSIDSSKMVIEEPPVEEIPETKYLQFDNDGYYTFLKYDNNSGMISNATFESFGQEPFCFKLNVVQNGDSSKFYIEEEYKDNYFESFYGEINKSDYVLILYNNETGFLSNQLKEYMGKASFVSDEKYKEVLNQNQN